MVDFLDFYPDKPLREGNCVNTNFCRCWKCLSKLGDTPTPETEFQAYLLYELIKNGLSKQSACDKLDLVNEQIQ